MSSNKRPIPEKMRKLVFKRDGYTCRYCGSKEPPFHADHVYPECRGGETSIDNLVTACESCNLKKASKVGVWPVIQVAQVKDKRPIGYRNYGYIPVLLFSAIVVFGLFIFALSRFTGSIEAGQAGVVVMASSGVMLAIVSSMDYSGAFTWRGQVSENDPQLDADGQEA